MKIFFLFSMALTVLAEEPLMTCQDSNYFVEFSKVDVGMVAKLWQKKMCVSDPRKLLAELPCFSEVIVECYDPRSVDTGYRISYVAGEEAGTRWAKIIEATFAGTKDLATLPCSK